MPSLLHQKPFLLATASTLSPEHNPIFVSSGTYNDVIILAILAILLLGAEEPEWKSSCSGVRIAPKQTFIRIIPIILIPD